jgi:hypothetical protein
MGHLGGRVSSLSRLSLSCRQLGTAYFSGLNLANIPKGQRTFLVLCQKKPCWFQSSLQGANIQCARAFYCGISQLPQLCPAARHTTRNHDFSAILRHDSKYSRGFNQFFIQCEKFSPPIFCNSQMQCIAGTKPGVVAVQKLNCQIIIVQ